MIFFLLIAKCFNLSIKLLLTNLTPLTCELTVIPPYWIVGGDTPVLITLLVLLKWRMCTCPVYTVHSIHTVYTHQAHRGCIAEDWEPSLHCLRIFISFIDTTVCSYQYGTKIDMRDRSINVHSVNTAIVIDLCCDRMRKRGWWRQWDWAGNRKQTGWRRRARGG